MVNVLSAMAMVPVRAAPGFAATLNTTVPFAVPLAPDVMVAHVTPLDAVHWQPAAELTATVSPDAAAAVTERLVGLIVTEHDGVGVGVGPTAAA